MKDKKHDDVNDATLSATAGRASDKEDAYARFERVMTAREAKAARLIRDPGVSAAAVAAVANAYAIVSDTFNPADTPQVHALLDQLRELGAVVVDRRGVERRRVERAEAEVAAARHRKK